MKQNDPTYLGDGVYASFDGYQIWLETERGDGAWHRIALEPPVMTALVAYAGRIWPPGTVIRTALDQRE
jgi:hypothetical protein